ncbi:phosphoribosylaminoimidazole carboxylase, ATPase subunit [Mobiluncus mulieris ATCC 35239]|uniref:N5-carboxyaminoimidazole ribonucleotide synthase n=2 Tax=Mobiluncus mulieris TaxID=2052 RepID=E0QPC5_9ACTO|nr:5-(carboxyamino)imidazole ribonucleotide synthase [Mobiluncus mulieris]EFM46558.1 phosphoribosylaminoimidazole carboxylase, ATPase subunit [Mobiluncus mulieris ATCC 35239]MCU9975504.1 5-(carboxyamino)imidazole ribonucleotide synthase [Mobiluncus mulieris]MCU9994737.1 5-(carboxyamino)imidazole ribonucleotide synthase [Mobiluncus mulieris]MCV0013741.1 5-(carboxyamino)imidazole ribonucleotide synthase [Mobiluncus mulieris]NMW63656.1 5-(carboxyamino)imidazole ribonucleotide synthase [Mobiluncus
MYQPPVVACIGAGQLARMMATAAGELGMALRVMANSADDPAALVLPETQVIVGSPADTAALSRLLAGASVLTFEHELIPDTVFDQAAAAGVAVHPRREALVYAKDKLAMRRRLGELGLPMPAWVEGDDIDGVAQLGKHCGWPLVAKVTHGGYDGRGVEFVTNLFDYQEWRERLDSGTQCLVEQRVPFTRELAVLGARRPSGEMRIWPVVQTWQESGQCAAVLQAPHETETKVFAQAEAIARRVAAELDVTGVFAVELFEVQSPSGKSQLYINELAMRPHNSGHWTQDGCVTSQFEQHLRAVLDLPLGVTTPTAPVTAMANVLGSALEDPGQAAATVMDRYPNVKIHLYRKGNRPGRKLGHVNVCGLSPEALLAEARAAADLLMGK